MRVRVRVCGGGLGGGDCNPQMAFQEPEVLVLRVKNSLRASHDSLLSGGFRGVVVLLNTPKLSAR